jgi:hypothetical protein
VLVQMHSCPPTVSTHITTSRQSLITKRLRPGYLPSSDEDVFTFSSFMRGSVVVTVGVLATLLAAVSWMPSPGSAAKVTCYKHNILKDRLVLVFVRSSHMWVQSPSKSICMQLRQQKKHCKGLPGRASCTPLASSTQVLVLLKLTRRLWCNTRITQ